MTFGAAEVRYTFEQRLAEVGHLVEIGLTRSSILVQLQNKYHLSEAESAELYWEWNRRRVRALHRRANLRLLVGGFAVAGIVAGRWWGPTIDLPAQIDVLILWALATVAAVSLWWATRIKKSLTTGGVNFAWGTGQVVLVCAALFSGLVLSVVQFERLPADQNPPSLSNVQVLTFENERFSALNIRLSGRISNLNTHWKLTDVQINYSVPGGTPGERLIRTEELSRFEVPPGESREYRFMAFLPREGPVEFLSVEWEWKPD